MRLRPRLRDRILPPFVADLLRDARHWLLPAAEGITFTAQGWQTPLPPNKGYESEAVIASDLEEWHSKWVPYQRQIALSPSAPLPGDPATWANLACTLAVAAHGRRSLRVLDYGGGLCPLRIVAQAILPQVKLEFHCKEVPALACIGRTLHPEVTWHDDDACLEQAFDLIVFGCVLQYCRDWASLVQRAARAARGHVYIADLAVVMDSESYVAVQRIRDASLLMLQVNRCELIEATSAAGLRPVREFPRREHQRIVGAPERPTYFSCLYERAGEHP